MCYLISQRQIKNKHGDPCDCLENGYITYFEKFGIDLIQVSNVSKRPVENMIPGQTAQGIILTGGNDICPEFYGQGPIKKSDYSPQRDSVEKKLLDLAVAKQIPVLGVCRGMQFINVYFGGTLIQDISSQMNIADHDPGKSHNVDLAEDHLFGWSGEDICVNSYHNQSVTSNRMSKELSAFLYSASDKGRIVEGLYHKKLPIAGIQSHPERGNPSQGFVDRIIEAFIERKLFWKNI